MRCLLGPGPLPEFLRRHAKDCLETMAEISTVAVAEFGGNLLDLFPGIKQQPGSLKQSMSHGEVAEPLPCNANKQAAQLARRNAELLRKLVQGESRITRSGRQFQYSVETPIGTARGASRRFTQFYQCR